MRLILLFAVAAMCAATAQSADATFAPLWSYQGAWHVTRSDLAPGAKPDELVNQCALLGAYFACQQTVNGKPSELLIFVAANKPGHYYTQSVNPEGRAGGRGDLEINGDQWTFSSTWDEGGKTTYYRTTNTFTGKDRIHFDQAESTNGKDYKVTHSGDDVRIGRARK